ncbi:MAG: Lysylphosphatidylglycerol synthetase/glycosyltransferase AglD [Firmicutes bacterium]|nr:Lysylphosphatidylglycerol synthetase/glycosyltransferase AglD [Bacillota bacterium]
MGKFYKRLLFLILFTGAISGAVIYFTLDINALPYLTAFRPWSLVVVALLWVVGMYFDGTRLLHLVRIAGHRITLLQAVQVIFSNYFLALLTPGATGGAVAQVMFLKRSGVPIGTAGVVVFIRTLMSILFLLLCLPFIFSFDPDLLPWISPQVLVAVSVLMLGSSALLIWFLRSGTSTLLLVKWTKRIKPVRRRKIFALYRDIRGAVFMMLASPVSMFRVFAESAASLVSLYSVVPIMFMGLGIDFAWNIVMGRMIFINILLYFAPTPGGSGIAEGGFVLLFGPLVPQGIVGILAVAWRIVQEYVPFIIGFYFAIKVFGRDYLMNEVK